MQAADWVQSIATDAAAHLTQLLQQISREISLSHERNEMYAVLGHIGSLRIVAQDLTQVLRRVADPYKSVL